MKQAHPTYLRINATVNLTKQFLYIPTLNAKINVGEALFLMTLMHALTF